MSSHSLRDPPGNLAAFLIAALAAILAYAPGLAGPFILDDHVNLAPIWQWLSGQRDAWGTIFDNRSGPSGRPIAYLSFLANAAVGGAAPLGFKLVNLALHLAAGWLALRWLGAVLKLGSDARQVPVPALLPVALASLWLLHPQHVSSVLYVVQRMALLGAIAQLAAVLVYLEARRALEQDSRRGMQLLFVAFPAVVTLGVLAKETAALAPLLCAVVEFTLFAGTRRPRSVVLFFALFLVLPFVAGLSLLIADPARLLAAYTGREFTLAERLLTQPRVLFDYSAGWFWPGASQLTLYRDGYPHSTDWLHPIASSIAMAGWLVLAVLAWLFRRRNACFATGMLWFLAAHALESSVFALEPYFEHRNYVASLGLLLAAFGLLRPVLGKIPPVALRVGIAVLVLSLCALTSARSYRWGDLDRLLKSEGPPAGEISRRLQIDRAIRGFELGDPEATDAALERLATGSSGDRAAAALWNTILKCDRDGNAGVDDLTRLRKNPPSVLTHNHVSWLGLLANRAARKSCEGLEPRDIDALLQDWQRAATQPPTAANQARLDALSRQLGGLAPEP